MSKSAAMPVYVTSCPLYLSYSLIFFCTHRLNSVLLNLERGLSFISWCRFSMIWRHFVFNNSVTTMFRSFSSDLRVRVWAVGKASGCRNGLPSYQVMIIARAALVLASCVKLAPMCPTISAVDVLVVEVTGYISSISSVCIDESIPSELTNEMWRKTWLKAESLTGILCSLKM